MPIFFILAPLETFTKYFEQTRRTKATPRNPGIEILLRNELLGILWRDQCRHNNIPRSNVLALETTLLSNMARRIKGICWVRAVTLWALGRKTRFQPLFFVQLSHYIFYLWGGFLGNVLHIKGAGTLQHPPPKKTLGLMIWFLKRWIFLRTDASRRSNKNYSRNENIKNAGFSNRAYVFQRGETKT